MTIRKVFLDWNQAAIPAAIEYLQRRYLQGSVWDLSGVVVVVPGGRAGRRLRELLVVASEQSGHVIFPPQLTTVGSLPELLYPRKRPFATVLTQKLAWTAALQQAKPACLEQFLSQRPAALDDPRWYELGSLLWHQHRELASDGLDFADVASQPGFAESARWHALAVVQSAYLAILDRSALWDRQTARLYALEHRQCATTRDIILLGTVDMNRALRMMIDQVRDYVTALIHADPACADRFDAYGCLIPEAWHEAEIDLDDRRILQVDSPADQGRAVVHHLHELQGRFAAEEITIGVPDEPLVPIIQQQLDQVGIRSRWGPGRSIEASRPVRLLRSIIDYLQRRRFTQLAELARHPDVALWMRERHGVDRCPLAELDQWQSQHMTWELSDSWPEDCAADPTRRLVRLVDGWLDELLGQPRPPAAWITPILTAIARVYGSRTVDHRVERDRVLLESCQAVRDAVLQLEQIPESIAEVSASQALLMAVDSIELKQIPAGPGQSAIELLGWLELPLDDAPALIVSGLNEGIVPTSANSDLFLPDSVRARLGLGDNARRYARDAYALSVLSHSRTELRLILSRRNWQGDPLPPSRLLFASPQRVVPRARRFFGETSDNPRLIQADPQPVDRSHHAFVVPRPLQLSPRMSLSVTDFRAYLACPYRFYLERILRLSRCTDGAVELDGAAFGSVVHEVLERFGLDSVRDSADAGEIEQHLCRHLDAIVQTRFGSRPLPAVQVQMAQMKQRLARFAVHQAEWRRRGWRIQQTEQNVRSSWESSDGAMELRGRIDRIDRNEDTGEWAILDYKSSDNGRSPRETHLGKGKQADSANDWSDLQLPLYRHLVPTDRPPQLGYVLLPKTAQPSGFQLADWSAAELELADQAARRVAIAIRDGIFWPPSDPPPFFGDAVAAICQDLVFDRRWEPLQAESRG